MKTYYLEITTFNGVERIDKITTDEEVKARKQALHLMRDSDIEFIKIKEVTTAIYCTTITRDK